MTLLIPRFLQILLFALLIVVGVAGLWGFPPFGHLLQAVFFGSVSWQLWERRNRSLKDWRYRTALGLLGLMMLVAVVGSLADVWTDLHASRSTQAATL